MAITPSSTSLHVGSSYAFSQSGIGSPRWGVKSGPGSISNLGVYTADALGTAVVRAMTNIWSSVDAGLTNADNNDLIQGLTSDYWYAYSAARLTAAGDQVDFIYHPSFIAGVRDASTLTWFVSGGLVYYDATVQYPPSPALVAGDSVSFVRIGSTQLGFKINGVLKYTFAQTMSGNIQPMVVARPGVAVNGDRQKAPTFAGAGVTGYTEYTATIEIALDTAPYISGDRLRQFVPKAALEQWLAGDKTADSEGSLILVDISENQRHAVVSDEVPTIATTSQNSKPAIYFDGTNDPFIFTGSVSCQHLFCVCAYEEDEFGDNEFPGIISDTTTYGLLAGEENTDEFHNFTGNGVYGFANADVGRELDDAKAPMSGRFAVIELIFPSALPLSGVVIGRDRGNTSRLWKGWFLESLIYSAVKTSYDRACIYRYFAMKYHLWPKNGSGSLYRFPFISNRSEAVEREQEHFLSEPYEGEPTALLRGTLRRKYQLPFLVRHEAEFIAAEQFLEEHQPLTHFTYRDERFYPARNVEVRATSSLKEQGGDLFSKFNYSFEVEEV